MSSPAHGAPSGTPASLSGRDPGLAPERLVAELVPPPRFEGARFDTYVPDPARPSQHAAMKALNEFAAGLGDEPTERGGRRALWPPRARRRRRDPEPRGVYLDGGFGVGKTHLLASLWHAAPVPPGRKAFCTFVELTHLVGALGFQGAVAALAGHRLLCVDEFELDDPGDTVLVSSLLGRLVVEGVALAATSNTLPGRLGEGRFASADFLREIQGLAAHFRALRVDGDDYRHRGLPSAPPPPDEAEVKRAALAIPGASLDDFGTLLGHLGRVHPSRYGALCDGVTAVCLTGVRPVPDQAAALRLVVLADRLYDRELPVRASGVPFDRLFGEEMLKGGYRKKYFRAISRLTALAREGAQRAERAQRAQRPR
ncbi:cell division protein ZapE [Streptomyces sp. PT12]|uniref:cell division protein ZapE n=1 Tax=Streptomyces sp. PT12 TaxID=1510197 RepID=UPI00215B8031|nr:cell division protein ZapE [Streptomyces sp. PT12]